MKENNYFLKRQLNIVVRVYYFLFLSRAATQLEFH
jgi:hypothetical protein